MNNLIRLFSATFLLLSLMTAAGCASTAKHEGTGEYVNDSVITTKVKAMLFDEPSLRLGQINVETFKDVVQLRIPQKITSRYPSTSCRHGLPASRSHGCGRPSVIHDFSATAPYVALPPASLQVVGSDNPLYLDFGEKYTHLTGLFAHLLRFKKGYMADYAPFLDPGS